MMKICVTMEIGNRTVVEQLVTAGNSRGDYRSAINDISVRLEMGTYGIPSAVPQMAAEDLPIGSVHNA